MQVVLQVWETQLGKNRDWEKAIYRPLFTLANTLNSKCTFKNVLCLSYANTHNDKTTYEVDGIVGLCL